MVKLAEKLLRVLEVAVDPIPDSGSKKEPKIDKEKAGVEDAPSLNTGRTNKKEPTAQMPPKKDDGSLYPGEAFIYRDGGIYLKFWNAENLEEAIAEMSKLPGGTPHYERGRDGKSLIFQAVKEEVDGTDRVKKAVKCLEKAGLILWKGEREAASGQKTGQK